MSVWLCVVWCHLKLLVDDIVILDVRRIKEPPQRVDHSQSRLFPNLSGLLIVCIRDKPREAIIHKQTAPPRYSFPHT